MENEKIFEIKINLFAKKKKKKKKKNSTANF